MTSDATIRAYKMRGAQGVLDECKKFTAQLKIDTSALGGRWR